MRVILTGLVITALLLLGAVFWLAGYAEKNPPNSGEQRIEVELPE